MPEWLKGKRLLVASLLIIAALLGLAGVLWSAGNLAHVTAEQRARLTQVLTTIRPDIQVEESQRIARAVEESSPTITREALKVVLARDFGIACLIAVALTIGMEMLMRSRLHDEVRTGVLEATYQTVIPEPIFEEVRNYIISAKVIRRNWRNSMVLRVDPKIARLFPDCVLSRTVVSYEMHPLGKAARNELISATMDEDVVYCVGNEVKYPRFRSLTIDRSIKPERFEGAQLQALLKKNGFRLEKEVRLDHNPIKVILEVEEIVRIPDTFSWNVPVQTDGAVICVDTSNAPDVVIDIRALHPDKDRLVSEMDGSLWTFAGGILPWQGFLVVTSWRKDSPSAKAATRRLEHLASTLSLPPAATAPATDITPVTPSKE